MSTAINMFRLVAFNIIYLLILFVAHVSDSSPKNISVECIKSYNVGLINISIDLYADLEEEQEEPDSSLVVLSNVTLTNKNIFHSVGCANCKGADIQPSLIYTFQTDLPPPYILS